MKQLPKILGLVGLFIVAFLFFLFFTFPYEVLKETVSAEASKMSGMDIRIGDLGPSFPIGLAVEDVVVKSGSGPELKIKKIEASIGILALLTGKIGAGIVVKATEKDYFEVDGKLGIFSLLGGGPLVPNEISLKSRNFPLGRFVDFLLAMAGDSPTGNPLIAPLLKQISFEAKLRSDITADLDASTPEDSTGKVAINFKDAMLRVTDPSLDIPNQNFELAKINGKLSKGVFKLDPKSGIRSSDLEIGIDGSISLKQPMMKSSLDMTVGIEIKGPLKNQFGFIMDAISGAQSDGKISLKIAGTLAQPSVNTF